MIKIVTAGVLAIPCIAVSVAVAPIVAILSIPPLLLLIYRGHSSGGATSNPKQVIIAGGSTGIGFSIAKECVKRGVPKVTIMARNVDKLATAKKHLETAASTTNSPTKIATQSVSVSDYASLQKIAQEMQIPKDDRVVLWNCAGIPYTTEFENIPIEQFQKLVMTNQLGAMYLVRAFLPHLKQGCMVLTSSAAAQVGVYGYTAYSPTKYALRGFAETIHAELIKSHNSQLHIQLAFPADTDTPGYEEEKKMMPEITNQIGDTGGLANPDDTAKSMVDAAFCQNPQFAVYFNLEGWMLATLTAGMSPVSTMLDALCQVALAGPLRLISLFILNDWWRIIRSHNVKPEKND